MRFFIFLIPLILFAKDIKIEDLIWLYKNRDYKKVCTHGIRIFEKFKNNDDLVTMYGLACLKADYIDRLAVPATILKKSKKARANAALFSTILTQKKLLFYALFDNVDISGLVFPETDHIISKIFTLYTQKKYIREKDIFIFNDPLKKDIKYKLILLRDENPCKILILELKNNIIVSTHKFW